jgi:hypothetical protein
MSPTPTIAYLSQGKLFLRREGEEPLQVESAYGVDLLETLAATRQKREWKAKSEVGRMMAGRSWGDVDPAVRRIHISGITRGDAPGTVLYALDTDMVGGLFRYDVAQDHEQRLFHDHQFRIRHLSRHPERPEVAFTLYSEDGTSGIALMQANGTGLQTLTEGDSLDEAPSWASPSRLVFQSAGIGRSAQGHPVGLGPYAVQQLDLEREELETLLEDPKKDFLLPRVAADGALHFIRRPYQPLRAPGVLSLLKDVLLLPVRLVWALIGFLNFFSLMFSGKPLSTAGGPKQEVESRRMMLWGKLIDAEQAERAAKKGRTVPLVPDDWELVRRTPAGEETLLARNVASYDLAGDGSVVFTDGSRVYHAVPGGERRQLCTGKLIEHVSVTG